jgi:hypothetical protein
VTRLFPPEAYVEFTAMSERALVYSPEQYSHRTLIVYEVVALREGIEDDMTSYFVRSLLSLGRINYPVTVRDKDGGFTTKTITQEGPTNLIFTTTKTRVHAENETRILSLSTDDSREQTKRVLRELADERDDHLDLSEWHDLQRWLATAEHRVTIPYARKLAELIPRLRSGCAGTSGRCSHSSAPTPCYTKPPATATTKAGSSPTSTTTPWYATS